MERTLDETPPRPLDLGRYKNPRADRAGPCNASPRLDREDSTTRYVWCPRGCHRRRVVLKVCMHHLILEFALRRFRAKRSIQGFYVGEISRQQMRARCYGSPIGHLNIYKKISNDITGLEDKLDSPVNFWFVTMKSLMNALEKIKACIFSGVPGTTTSIAVSE